MTDSGYYALAGAIIEQACKDFRTAYSLLKRVPDSSTAESMVKDVTKFFCSEYFNLLTDLDGPWLLRKLKEEIDKGGDAR